MVRQFPEVTRRDERKFLLAHWRYLLGWESKAPSPTGLDPARAEALESLACQAVELSFARLGVKLASITTMTKKETKCPQK